MPAANSRSATALVHIVTWEFMSVQLTGLMYVVSPPPRMGVLLKQFRPGNCYDDDDVDDDDDGDALAQEYEEYSYDPYDKD